MNTFVIATYIFAAAFLIYSFIFYKKKKVIYSLRAKNFVILDDKFYIAQFIGGIISSIILVIFAIAHDMFPSFEVYGIVCVIVFWVVNLTVKAAVLIKGYASIPGVM